LRNEPNWVEPDDLLIINEDSVRLTDEPFGVLNEEALHSAAASPRSHWHYDEIDNIAALAVRLCVAVARAHAFVQGNKRTGYISSLQFLGSNGYFLDAPDTDEVAAVIEEIVERKREEAELVALYEEWLIETA
jgi:death-on-curing protein